MKKVLLLFSLIILIFPLFSSCFKKTFDSNNSINKTILETGKSFEGVWQSSYNNNDLAIIHITNETKEGFDFNLSIAEHKTTEQLIQGGFKSHANFREDGTAKYSSGNDESMTSLIHVEGCISLKNDSLTITYEKLETYTDKYYTSLPNKFHKIPNDKEIEALYSLPFNSLEDDITSFTTLTISEADTLFGSPIEITQTEHYAGEGIPDIMTARKYNDTTVWFYYPDGINGKYKFDHIETKNTSINFIRNIRIGDNLASVLSKFPNENREITNKYGEKIKPLYGEPVHLSNYGQITYPDDKTISAWYADSWYTFKFEFNNNKELIKIAFSYSD